MLVTNKEGDVYREALSKQNVVVTSFVRPPLYVCAQYFPHRQCHNSATLPLFTKQHAILIENSARGGVLKHFKPHNLIPSYISTFLGFSLFWLDP